ncbi:MAG: OsmC family protein [Gemmatimonadota bacterium]
MSGIDIVLEGRGECVVRQRATGVELRTSKSPEYGGTGTSFSSTDLLAAALGTCIATDVEPVAERHGIEAGSIRVHVSKLLSVRPKRIESLSVVVVLPAGVPPDVVVRLERAAGHCLVHRSLSPEIEVRVRVRDRTEGEGA